jgi:diacylglycerol kinase
MQDFSAGRTWARKFGDAFRGFKRGVRGESSFSVHFFCAATVVAAAIALGVSLQQWCLLLLCISAVLSAEMFNTSLEWIAKAITRERDERIGAALDMGSAAVLLVALGSASVGAVIFIHRIGELAGRW